MRNQAKKKTDFTVDLIWLGSLRLAPVNKHVVYSSICTVIYTV